MLVTAAEVTENLPMQEMLFRSTFRWRLRPRSVTRDAALRHQGEHSGHIEKAGIRAYSALADQGKRTSLLTIEDFVYDAQRDVYTSPETRSCAVGATITGRVRRGGYVRYAANSSACNECPLKSKRTNSPRGRWVSCGLEEEYLERVRPYRETEPYRHRVGA